MHAKDEQPGRKAPAGPLPARAAVPAAAPGVRPATPEAVMALQRSVGNRVVARLAGQDQHVHGAGCGHEGGAGSGGPEQRALLDAAVASPSRPLSGSLRADAESFYQNDLSATRLHDSPVAQRATAAMGAQAMTIGTHVFLGAGASASREIIGHELGHVDKNVRGVPETGRANGSGVSVTDPGQHSERTAAADGAAFAAGETTAPSVVAQRATAPGGGAAPGDGAMPVQRAGGSSSKKGKDKEPSPRQIAKSIDKEVKERWDHSYGGGRQGAGPDEVRVRYARSMADDRTSQTLSHQTFLHYDAMAAERERKGGKGVDEREVQGMLVNNRLLFASNFNESMDLLRPYAGDGSRDRYRDIVSQHQSDAGRRGNLPAPDAREYVDRLNRADAKTQAVLDGERGQSADGTAEALRKRYGKPVAIVDIDNPGLLHTLLTAKDYEGAVFLLRFPAEAGLMHAEQKLLLALRRSGITPKETKGSPHAIMGRYRGCLCCTAALMYYRNELGFDTLDFDPNPGFYYWESLDNLYRHQAHVVQDPRFREIMLELAAQLPSTPALSRMQPPEDAYDNHGPERVEDASVAARRNYRSPSNSDVEYDEDGAYRSVARPMDVAAAGGTGGAKVGKGAKIDKESKKGKSRLRAARIITSQEDQAQIQQTWLHGTREEQTTLFRYWENDRGASRAELIEIVHEVAPDRSPDSIQSAIYRLVKGRTGHESRDNRTPGDPVVRRPDKGRYADKSKSAVKKATRGPAKKTMTHKSTGWTKIQNAMKADRDTSPFYGEWRKLEKKGRSGSYIPPSQMSPGLAATVAGQRAKYTVSSMAGLLHMSENTLRHFLSKNYGDPQEETVSGDTEMAEAEELVPVKEESPEPGPSVGYPVAGWTPEPREETPLYTRNFGGLSLDAEAEYEPPGVGPAGVGPSTVSFDHPAVTGYTVVTDAYGQRFYREDDTGDLYVRDPQTGRMTYLDEDVQMTG
ncbi:eCIS core domain-containing protein [Streptomyces albidoflavus]